MYNGLVQRTAADQRVAWVVNNPWESLYMRARGVCLPTSLVRTFGYSALPAQDIPDRAREFCGFASRSAFDQLVMPKVGPGLALAPG
jgi:hypothetical protein